MEVALDNLYEIRATNSTITTANISCNNIWYIYLQKNNLTRCTINETGNLRTLNIQNNPNLGGGYIKVGPSYWYNNHSVSDNNDYREGNYRALKIYGQGCNIYYSWQAGYNGWDQSMSKRLYAGSDIPDSTEFIKYKLRMDDNCNPMAWWWGNSWSYQTKVNQYSRYGTLVASLDNTDNSAHTASGEDLWFPSSGWRTIRNNPNANDLASVYFDVYLYVNMDGKNCRSDIYLEFWPFGT